MSDFNPSKFNFSNLLYIERRTLFQNFVKLVPKLKGNVLDVGCGQKPYECLFVNSNKYLGLDHLKSKNDKKNKADFFL